MTEHILAKLVYFRLQNDPILVELEERKRYCLPIPTEKKKLQFSI